MVLSLSQGKLGSFIDVFRDSGSLLGNQKSKSVEPYNMD